MRFSNWLIGLAVAAMVAAAWFLSEPDQSIPIPFQGDLKSVSYAAWRQDATSLREARADTRRYPRRSRTHCRQGALGPHL
jgi:hypothetical protein